MRLLSHIALLSRPDQEAERLQFMSRLNEAQSVLGSNTVLFLLPLARVGRWEGTESSAQKKMGTNRELGFLGLLTETGTEADRKSVV